MAHTTNYTSNGIAGDLKKHWKNDLIASFSVALIALPLGLGIAASSGISPIAGAISALCGGLITTWIRGSHVAINGPGNALIPIVFGAMTQLNDGTGKTFQYLLAAFIISGALICLLGLLKLGKYGQIFPTVVVFGMMSGIGIIIIVNQIHAATGYTPSSHSEVGMLLEIPKSIAQANGSLVLLTLIGISILLCHSSIKSVLFRFIPGPVWAISITIGAVWMLNHLEIFQQVGLETVGTDQLVSVPKSIFQQIPFPDFSRWNDPIFIMVVVSFTFVSALETILCARASQKIDPAKKQINYDKELIGTGLATLISAGIGGIPVLTVVAQTSVNVHAGGRSSWSNFFHGCIILLFLVFGLPIIAVIPKAALSAILLIVGYRLISPDIWKKISLKGPEQVLVFSVTMVSTVFLGLVEGVFIGAILTFIIHIIKSKVNIKLFYLLQFYPSFRVSEEDDGKLNVRLKGILNFVSLARLKRLLEQLPRKQLVSVSFTNSPILDASTMEYLCSFRDNYISAGGDLVLLGLSNYQSPAGDPESLHVLKKEGDKVVPRPLTKRQKQLKLVAGLKHWSFEPKDQWEWQSLKESTFFGPKNIQSKRNVIRGKYEKSDVQWELSDINFSNGSILASKTHDLTAHLLYFPFELPIINIKRESFFDNILDITDHKTINSLNVANETKDAYGIHLESLLNYLHSAPLEYMESTGNQLIYFSKPRLARAEEITAMVRFAEELISYISKPINSPN